MDNETTNDMEVKEFTQTVHITPSKDDEELVDEENDTQPQSSEEENEPEQDPKTEEVDETDTVEEPEQEAEPPKNEPKPVEGETPRERALRLEATRLKGLLRKERQDELFVQKPLTQQPQDEDLSQYDPDELKRFELLAKKMGFAKKDEIIHQTTQDRNSAEFETFIEAHPEYAPENDKDGVLWNQFKSEFALYQPPQDHKTLRKVLNKVHNEIFGVQPAQNLNKINAAREKIKVASHTGASVVKTAKAPVQRQSGLRLDGLKGFSEEELNDLLN